MDNLTIYAGVSKTNETENFNSVTFKRGHIYCIVGDTGSGKSRLIKDIEQFVNADSLTKRKIYVDGNEVSLDKRNEFSTSLVSHLSQNMRFVLDASVYEFLELHKQCRYNTNVSIETVLKTANLITKEPIVSAQDLTSLSGGQTRALMIADIALISDNPIILIDEIENAGINKHIAFGILLKSNKLIFIATHDPHTSLLGDKRIIMKNGAIDKIIDKSPLEAEITEKLKHMYNFQIECQTKIKKGELLNEMC
ncbi:MAG: ABC transporter ATP-binding protein [Epulopiscium sp. Nuni2H_MBin003]|nr:MAG: ABC transporter ATP-binding protein [Epulopiscium sp. Nuni2H_MBin003]